MSEYKELLQKAYAEQKPVLHESLFGGGSLARLIHAGWFYLRGFTYLSGILLIGNREHCIRVSKLDLSTPLTSVELILHRLI